ECCVCTGSFPQHHFSSITSMCDHEPTVCDDCISQSVNTQVIDVAWDKIKCPECPATLRHPDVKSWASEELFEKYDKQSTVSVLPANFMAYLSPDCSSGQIHDGGDEQPIMTCVACGFKACYLHKRPWHPGQTCAKYDVEHQEIMKQEAKSETYIIEKLCAQTCPSCGVRIQKSSGCDHMTCHRCNFEFCFACLASYKKINREGNSAHSQSCRHH
ncbi:hypothetical protein DL98DRAFT_362001, partial [Cadophora sp. DSE1049]